MLRPGLQEHLEQHVLTDAAHLPGTGETIVEDYVFRRFEQGPAAIRIYLDLFSDLISGRRIRKPPLRLRNLIQPEGDAAGSVRNDDVRRLHRIGIRPVFSQQLLPGPGEE